MARLGVVPGLVELLVDACVDGVELASGRDAVLDQRRRHGLDRIAVAIASSFFRCAVGT